MNLLPPQACDRLAQSPTTSEEHGKQECIILFSIMLTMCLWDTSSRSCVLQPVLNIDLG